MDPENNQIEKEGNGGGRNYTNNHSGLGKWEKQTGYTVEWYDENRAG